MVLSAFVFLVRSIPSLDGAKRSLINIQVWVHPHVFPWFLPIIQISLNGSIWSTVSVTVERLMVYIIFNLIQLNTKQWMTHMLFEILENRSTKVSPAVSSTSALVPLGLGVRMVT